MADRTLKGTRIGATSLQAEEGVEFAPRQVVEYLTDRNRRIRVTFDADAEVPAEWADPRTGEIGFLDDEAGQTARAEFQDRESQQRTPWDMLIERRTREELEEILQDRLEQLRARRGSASSRASGDDGASD